MTHRKNYRQSLFAVMRAHYRPDGAKSSLVSILTTLLVAGTLAGSRYMLSGGALL